MKIQFINETSTPIPKQYISKAFQFFTQQLKKRKLLSGKNKTLIFVFVSQAEMKKTYFRFKKKKYVTDVLSFEPIEESNLGELVFCPTKIKLQAQEHKLSFRDELVYLLFHGVLHLLGFEHEKNPRKAKEMFSLQDKMFFDFLKK